MDLKFRYILFFLFFINYINSQDIIPLICLENFNNEESFKNLNFLKKIECEDYYIDGKMVKLELMNYSINNDYKNLNFYFLVEFSNDKIIFSFYNKLKLIEMVVLNKGDLNFDLVKKFINENLTLIQSKKENKIIIKEEQKGNYRDFPYFSFLLAGITYRINYDERPNVFSFFPINFYFDYFILKYLEGGAFFRLSYNTNLIKYYNVIDERFYSQNVLLDLEYGISLGFSLFYEKTHYSIGFAFFNKSIFFDEKNFTNYILPNFAIYQKINIKISKIFYYTIFINFKTTQKYTKYDIIKTEAFNYNLPVIELSLLGISIIF